MLAQTQRYGHRLLDRESGREFALVLVIVGLKCVGVGGCGFVLVFVVGRGLVLTFVVGSKVRIGVGGYGFVCWRCPAQRGIKCSRGSRYLM